MTAVGMRLNRTIAVRYEGVCRTPWARKCPETGQQKTRRESDGRVYAHCMGLFFRIRILAPLPMFFSGGRPGVHRFGVSQMRCMVHPWICRPAERGE